MFFAIIMLMFYHSHTIRETLKDLNASADGLSHAAASARLRHHGKNRLSHHAAPQYTPRPFNDAYLLVLLVAFGSSLIIAETTAAILFVCIILVNTALRLVQHKTHLATLQRTTQLAGDTALVKRDGLGVDLATNDIVPGDIVMLHQGDHIPADGRLLHATELHVKEYQLTGNEDPVAKHTSPVHSDSELGHRSSMVFRGSYVTSGTGEYVVTATGDSTMYSALSHHAMRVTKRSTLQQKVETMTNRLILVSLGTAAALVVISLGRGAPWYTATEYAIVIIAAAIPAMLPVVIAIITTQGIDKLATKNILVSSLRAIEQLSMLTTLVMGKTKFITTATPEIVELWHPQTTRTVLAKLIGHTLAWHESERDYIDTILAKTFSAAGTSRPAVQFLFDRRTQLSGNIWHYARSYELTVKGSPEKILELSLITENEREIAWQQLQKYTAQGYQVIALAHCTSDTLISSLAQLDETPMLEFAGFIALKYSIVPGAKRTLMQLSHAGVTPRLITGDAVDTSYALARRINIATSRKEAIDARRLTVVPAQTAHHTIQAARVYARTTIETATQVVASLKQHSVVGATADGSDDIPVLARAHIGITLRDSATLAHEASDVVLLSHKNHLQTLYEAIKVSRSIVSNIRRILFYTFTTSLAEVTIAIASLLFVFPLVLSPLQIIWANITIYTILVLGLAIEPDSRNIMKRRPVSPKSRVFPAFLGLRMCILALTMATVTCSVFIVALNSYDLAYAQTLAFHAFVVMQIIGVLAARSDHTSLFIRFRTWSPAVYTGVVCATIIQSFVLFSPIGEWLIGSTPQPVHVAIVTLVAIITFTLVSELTKLHSRRTVRQKEEQMT